MTDASGCQNKPDEQAPAGADSGSQSAIIISNENIPASEIWRRATSLRAAAKEVCDEGRGVGESGRGVYLDFADAIGRVGEETIRERYGNLFHIYEKITGENAYKRPMRIYPAVHYTMGGLWVDYNLMSNVPGLHVIGEANFSDHGANRLGASALMQGLADGYFVLPYTLPSVSGRTDRQAARRRIIRNFGKRKATSGANQETARRSMENVRWIRFIANWVISFGTNAEWLAMPPD